MDNETSGGGILFILLLIACWYLWSQHNQIISLQAEKVSLQESLSEANLNIDTANTNIDDLNSSIEDAQGEAWSDYDTMGSTLENLETGEKVENVPDTTQ